MSQRPLADPFAGLRRFTSARIGLGRSGDGWPTSALLAFQAAASQARDAVHEALDLDLLDRQLAPRPWLRVDSLAADRGEYLRRPDLGRRLPESTPQLDAVRGDYDLAIVLCDGLSARAVMEQAVTVLEHSLPALADLRLAPLVVAGQGRVALGDPIARRLGARMVAVLIGERPGLSVPASLGIYLTWAPQAETPDSARNCISNIHAAGLDPAAAAAQLVWLVRAATRLQLTGTGLKPGTDKAGIEAAAASTSLAGTSADE
ncbi:ethanolamine ammonia-lyase subunit EutC [Frateuria aurantia]